MKKKVVDESLNEFSKNKIDSTDDWDSDIEDDETMDDVDIDTSDMEDVEEIEIEDDLINALKNELKIPEFNRGAIKFRLRGDISKVHFGVPMAQLKNDAFLFKLEDGSIKKIYLGDMILEHEKSNRAKFINEEFEDYRD